MGILLSTRGDYLQAQNENCCRHHPLSPVAYPAFSRTVPPFYLCIQIHVVCGETWLTTAVSYLPADLTLMHTHTFYHSGDLVTLRWRVRMNIINKYFFVFSISLLLYRTEAIGFSHTIVWPAPPGIEKISHQQLT